MEDEGRVADHTSGVSATDGRWHHIAGGQACVCGGEGGARACGRVCKACL